MRESPKLLAKLKILENKQIALLWNKRKEEIIMTKQIHWDGALSQEGFDIIKGEEV